MPTFRLDHALATERDTLKFRLLALFVIAVSLVVREESIADVPALPTLSLVGGYLAYAIFLDQYLLPRFQNIVLVGVMLVADTVTLLAALAIIGLTSPVFIFLPVLVVYYSLYLGYAGSLTAATLSSLGYAFLGRVLNEGEGFGDIVSIQVPAFYLIALLTGYLSSQRLREREEKRALQHVIETETSTRGMLDLARRMQDALDPGAIAGDLAHLGARLARAPLCAIYRVEGGTHQLVGLAAEGTPEGTALSEVAQRLEPLREVAEAERLATLAQPYTYSPQVRYNGLLPLSSGGGEANLLALPIPTPEGTVYGVVYFLGTRAEPEEEDMEGLQGFAQHAGSLLGRLEVFPQAQRQSARVVSDLRLTLQNLGRFQDLQARRQVLVGQLAVDPAAERAVLDGQTVSLSKTEFDVLYLLAAQAGLPVSSETLLHEVWGPDFVAQGNVVDVCIHRLRRKLSRAQPQGSRLIRTVRGRGYMFQDLGA